MEAHLFPGPGNPALFFPADIVFHSARNWQDLSAFCLLIRARKLA
jgi:hypothetical protein